eukprot:1342099-Amorphochlora_amoeboformis.AAC.1
MYEGRGEGGRAREGDTRGKRGQDGESEKARARRREREIGRHRGRGRGKTEGFPSSGKLCTNTYNVYYVYTI